MAIHVNKRHISSMYNKSIQFLNHQSKNIVIFELINILYVITPK